MRGSNTGFWAGSTTTYKTKSDHIDMGIILKETKFPTICTKNFQKKVHVCQMAASQTSKNLPVGEIDFIFDSFSVQNFKLFPSCMVSIERYLKLLQYTAIIHLIKLIPQSQLLKN